MEVVPTEALWMALPIWGHTYPAPTPMAMARKIHRVKNRSRNERRFMPSNPSPRIELPTVSSSRAPAYTVIMVAQF